MFQVLDIQIFSPRLPQAHAEVFGVHCCSLQRLQPNTNQRCCRHISLMCFPSAPVAGLQCILKHVAIKSHTHTTRWDIKRHTPVYANTCTVNKVGLFGRLYQYAQVPAKIRGFFSLFACQQREGGGGRERGEGLSETDMFCRCWLIHCMLKKWVQRC